MGRRVHERAEELLVAAGRGAEATSEEYLRAVEQAQRELGPEAGSEVEGSDWVAQQARQNALANWALATLEARGGKFSAEEYLGEIERCQRQVESSTTDSEEESLSLEERVARLEARERSRRSAELLAPSTRSEVRFEEMLSSAMDSGAVLASSRAAWRAIYTADPTRAVEMLTALTARASP
jgi:hypothetical protein